MRETQKHDVVTLYLLITRRKEHVVIKKCSNLSAYTLVHITNEREKGSVSINHLNAGL